MRYLHGVMFAVAGVLSSPLAMAGEADFDINCGAGPAACQAAFKGVIEDASASLSHKALGPAEATGVTGFGVGAFVNYSPVSNDSDWQTLTNSNVDAVGIAGIAAHKGLPFGFDVGAFYAAIPGTGAKAYGAELRYAILEGGVASPALALRGSYTATSGIDDFDYDAWGADISVSKGFTFLTPYAGIGFLSAKGDPKSAAAAAAGLSKVTVDSERFFVGMRITLAILEITPEYERQGDNNSYNLRLGFSF
jgi:hypothetical protein